MKKLFKRSCLCVLLLNLVLSLFFLFGCSENTDASTDNQLSIYVLQEEEIVPIINNFNTIKNKEVVKISEFEDTNALFTKLQSEIMAGKGPDLIYYNYNTNNQNMQKYIDNDVFADLNELISKDSSDNKLNLDNYNKVIIDAGLVNGKQVFMPLTYLTDVFVTTNENYDRYDLSMESGFSFDSLGEDLSDFKRKQNDNISICTSLPYTLFFDKLIEEEVFNNNEVYDFYSDEFKRSFYSIEETYVTCNVDENYDVLKEMANGNLMFLGNGYLSGNPYVSIQEADHFFNLDMTPKILSYSNNKNDFSSYVGSFLAINANSNQKELAYDFIKFALNDEQQMKLETNDIPVNNESYENYINKAENIIKNSTGHQDKLMLFLEEYEAIIDQVSSCKIRNYYYYENISYSLLNDYLEQNIDYDTLVSELSTKTKIFFDE